MLAFLRFQRGNVFENVARISCGFGLESEEGSGSRAGHRWNARARITTYMHTRFPNRLVSRVAV